MLKGWKFSHRAHRGFETHHPPFNLLKVDQAEDHHADVQFDSA